MDAYMIQRWERTKELAEECGIKVTVRDFIAMFDSRGLNLGCHATVDEAYAFMCGYAARSERCEGN